MRKFYYKKKVLVTGGAGFIGSYIVEKLVNLGAKVTVIDNLQTGFLHNLKSVINNITFLEKSIKNENACLEATKNKEIIFHLAAQVSVPESIQNPKKCFKITIQGTENLLESARINNVKRLIFSSSAAVYGIQKGECTESIKCRPTSPYGTSKLIGELLCQQHSHNYNLQTICLRYFNVFGERQDPNGAYAGVVAKFSDSIKKNKSITLFGDGKQTRDFVPVNKIVEANLLLGMQNKTFMNGQPVNIATGNSITLLELIKTLKQKYPKYKKNIIFKPAREGDIQHSIANINKLNQIKKSKI